MQELLQDNWDPDAITGRDPVPQPNIVVEGTRGYRSVHTSSEDIIFVQDGGRPIVEAASVGHMEEHIEAVVDLQIQTSESEMRFYGDDGLDDYEGIAGETKRILDKFRIGFGSYDRLGCDTFEDQIGEYGADRWVGTWVTRLYKYAAPISQEATR